MVQFLARMVVPAKMENVIVLLSEQEIHAMNVSFYCCKCNVLLFRFATLHKGVQGLKTKSIKIQLFAIL